MSTGYRQPILFSGPSVDGFSTTVNIFKQVLALPGYNKTLHFLPPASERLNFNLPPIRIRRVFSFHITLWYDKMWDVKNKESGNSNTHSKPCRRQTCESYFWNIMIFQVLDFTCSGAQKNGAIKLFIKGYLLWYTDNGFNRLYGRIGNYFLIIFAVTSSIN